MKKIFFITFILGVLIACSKEMLAPTTPTYDGDVSFISASIIEAEEGFLDDLPRLRSSIDYPTSGNATYRWSAGDKIGAVQIINNNPPVTYAINADVFQGNFPFSLANEGVNPLISQGIFASEELTFSGLTEGEQYFFYYPYNENAIVNGELVFNMPPQKQEGSASTISNLSGRDFMFSLDTIIAENQQRSLVASELDQVKFSHATASLKYKIAGSSAQTKIYCIDLHSGSSIFATRATLSAETALRSRGNSIPLQYYYSNETNSMPLYLGENGYTLSSSSDTLMSSLLLFPIDGMGNVNVYLHTNKGTYTVPKNITTNIVANKYYSLNINNLSSSPLTSTTWDNASSILPPPIIGDSIFIYCAAHLAWISSISYNTYSDPRIGNNVTFNGYKIKMINDIDLNNITWKPIKDFEGVFDGNGRTISGLYIYRGSIMNFGVFSVNYGTIKNLIIKAPYISSLTTHAGAIAGSNSNNGLIVNCHVIEGGTITGGNYIGGIVGYNSNTGLTFGDCSVDPKTTISGRPYYGRKCGYPSI